MTKLTGEWQEALVCGLEPPLEDTHILVEREGGALLLHGDHSTLVEFVLVHFRMSLCVHM